jgi:hypothetical protein
LTGTVLGATVEIECTTVNAHEASIENPESGNGVGSGTTLLGSCTVKKPAGGGCKVVSGTVKGAEIEELSELPEGDWISLKAKSGTILFEAELESCSMGTLNKKYEVKGSMAGLWDNEESVVLYGTTTKQKEEESLTLGGNKALLSSKVLVSVVNEESENGGVFVQ